jgi:hypothetical protein
MSQNEASILLVDHGERLCRIERNISEDGRLAGEMGVKLKTLETKVDGIAEQLADGIIRIEVKFGAFTAALESLNKIEDRVIVLEKHHTNAVKKSKRFKKAILGTLAGAIISVLGALGTWGVEWIKKAL